MNQIPIHERKHRSLHVLGQMTSHEQEFGVVPEYLAREWIRHMRWFEMNDIRTFDELRSRAFEQSRQSV